MILDLLNSDILVYILDICTDEIEYNIYYFIIKFENILYEYISLLINKNKIYMEQISWDFSNNNSTNWFILLDNIWSNIYLNNIIDIFNIYIYGNVKIVYLQDNNILYLSKKINNPNYYDLLKISDYITKKYNITNDFILRDIDYININDFIKVCNIDNINYYIIDFNWQIWHLENLYGIEYLKYKYNYNNNIPYCKIKLKEWKKNVYDVIKKFKNDYNNIDTIKNKIIKYI
jgi:hypothetical protein|tara:strand:+ start:164 stop:859 length:696 start_codon:yes stop_codon:yes gene_type:complete